MKELLEMLSRVVNCFRSLYLWGNLQLHRGTAPYSSRCELLSFFVPLGEFTAERLPSYFNGKVVNCFRSLYLWGNLQRRNVIKQTRPSCELLSFFVPLGEFTAYRYCKNTYQ